MGGYLYIILQRFKKGILFSACGQARLGGQHPLVTTNVLYGGVEA